MTKVKEIDALALKKLLDNNEVVLIDVREKAEFDAERIKGAIFLPLSTFDPQDIPKTDKKLVIMCQSGIRSANVCMYLAQNDAADGYNLKDGINSWKKAGLPIVK